MTNDEVMERDALADRAEAILISCVEKHSISYEEAVSLARDWLVCIGGKDALAVIDGGPLVARSLADMCAAILDSVRGGEG